MNKKTILLFLIALTAAVTWYLYKEPLSIEKRAAVEAELAKFPEKFPATPVWWSDGDVLAVGVLPRENGEKHNDTAKSVCPMLWKHDVNGTVVEIYDILLIQKSDDWELIGAADCRRQAE